MAASSAWRRATDRHPRTAAIVPAVVVVGLPLLVALIALAGRRWYPVLDLAMTELRIRDVGSGQTPLIGLPGRIGEFPEQGSHPGPLSFWLLAPGYRLFGSTAWAMEAATVLLQFVWISLAMWIGYRRGGRTGVVMVALVMAVLVRGYGLTVMIQPWNPYLPLLAWVVVLLATWSVFCGDHMMLVPLAVAASFAAQTHIPYLVMAGGLGLIALGVVVVRCWRSDDRRSFVGPLAWTSGVFALLWLAPLVDQIRRDPGNIRRLIDHFTAPTEDTLGIVDGFELLLRHLDVVNAYARLLVDPDVFFDAGNQPWGPIWPGLILLGIWLGSVVVSIRLQRDDPTLAPLVRLHWVIAVSLGLGLISMVRIFGTVWYYLTLWAWGTTTLLIVAVGWTIVAWSRSRGRAGIEDPGGLRVPSTGSVLIVAAGVTLIVTGCSVWAAPGTDHPEERLGDVLGELVTPTAEALDAGVGAADGPDGRYVVTWTDAYYFGSQSYGMMNELERLGFDVGMYEPWRVPATPQRVLAVGEVTAEVILATGAFVEQWRAHPDVVEVAAVDLRTAAELERFQQLRAELIDELDADGLDDLIDLVDTNLFGVRIDTRLDPVALSMAVELLDLGQETTVFIGPAGVTQ